MSATPLTLTADQLAAVERAVAFPASVLTGGPGTGKTTATNAILDALGRGQCIILAPTGKAAKRASEVTGHRAMTVHAWCGRAEKVVEEEKRSGDAGEWNGAKDHPAIPCVVCDESSMLSSDIFARFLGLWRGDRLVIVGDVDQLPSVGPGRILADLIDSGVVPVTRLRTVQRQAEGSPIIRAAHAINAGRRPPLANDDAGFYVLRTDGKPEHETVAMVAGAVMRAVERWGLDVRRDVQVLGATRREIDALNAGIRAVANPRTELSVEVAGFREGDKALVTKNLYQLGVVNGDAGVVASVHPRTAEAEARIVLETFAGERVEFVGRDVEYLRLAWAMTVHKSQGSEYPFVVHVLSGQGARLFGRAHLYTAITRAKGRVVIATNPSAWADAIGRPTPKRHTRLAGLLRTT